MDIRLGGLTDILWADPGEDPRTYFAFSYFEYLGDHLRHARLARHLNQQDLAEQLQVPVTSAASWEKNVSQPWVQFHPAIVRFLGYIPSFLWPRTLSQTISTLRSLLGLTRPDLAERIGVGKNPVYNWEKDLITPTERNLLLLEEFVLSPEHLPLLRPVPFVHLLKTLYAQTYRHGIRQKYAEKKSRRGQNWGQHIGTIRQMRHLSQKEAAEAIGVSERRLRDWENTGREPTFRHWPAIIAFLGYVPWFVLPQNGSLSERLQVIRKLHGLRTKEMADLLGVSVSTLQRWETEKRHQKTILAWPQVQALLRGEIELNPPSVGNPAP